MTTELMAQVYREESEGRKNKGTIGILKPILQSQEHRNKRIIQSVQNRRVGTTTNQ